MTLEALFTQGTRGVGPYDKCHGNNSKCGRYVEIGHCGGAGSNEPNCVEFGNPTNC